jgi:hypothetical protein
VKFEHATIIDKNISLFARAVMEIFIFFSGKVTFAPPGIFYLNINSQERHQKYDS